MAGRNDRQIFLFFAFLFHDWICGFLRSTRSWFRRYSGGADMKAKILSFFRKPQQPEIRMSVEIKPSATRAVDAYKKLQVAHASAAAKILEQSGIIAELLSKIDEAKAILDEVFPEDMGGSTGGVVG